MSLLCLKHRPQVSEPLVGPPMGNSALQAAVTRVSSITSDDDHFYEYGDPYGSRHLLDLVNEYRFAL